MPSILEVQNLVKRYGDFTAVKGISFNIEKTDGQASGLSVMLGMVMALMGGCWYPLEMFPETVQNIVKVLPRPGQCKACSILFYAAEG